MTRLESARRVAEWRRKNPERVAVSNAASYAANREAIAARRQANPEPRRVADANRRARKARAQGTHTAKDVALLVEMQMGKCAACGVAIGADRHVDHIVPLALGGGNGRDNLQILCKPCNLRKGAKDPIDFARSLGRLL